jgi:intein-encoded DNA endonuclease-like protein
MKYTKEQVEKVKEKLKNLPPIEETKDLSKQEAIKMLQKDILILQKRGYSLEKIAEVLKQEGVEISTPTLKSYLQRGKTKKEATLKEKSAQK